ncbi:MAG: hypothetical protein FWG20_03000, partial [Candidatus Cloacimonetes bacterium]|nr:hypothetical protein [Candidatus Cloacimonadota bacterium]
MKVKAIKMHSQGNDLLFLDLLDITKGDFVPQKGWGEFAKHITHRHFGIGADGLVLIQKSDSCEATIRIFNSDGTEAETCGSAFLCGAFYLWEKTGQQNAVFQTIKGNKACTVNPVDKSISVNMGCVTLEKEMTYTLFDHAISGHCVSISNPHFVVFDSEFLRENELGFRLLEGQTESNIENVAIVG